ncbi:MAG: bifunctional nuclease family protein [Calditerrivibrio sp.]|nr:bifunctional nuclease family protein [Calditerrivibrio sp.]MCA1932704.1 bifunctional nuclease family protein [Calditerrivibrio sp.]
MLQFKVKCVIKDPLVSTYSVVLQSIDDNYMIVIPIGPFEAEAIYTRLVNIRSSRPMTHDLMGNILSQLGDVKLIRMCIDSIKDGIFTAKLEMEHGGKPLRIDCRPSDGIALSLRSNTPIYVEEDLAKRKNCVSKRCLSDREKVLIEQLMMDQEMTYL